MNPVVAQLLGVLAFPGLLTVIGLALLNGMLGGTPALLGVQALPRAFASRDGVFALIGLLAVGAGSALLPWPFNPLSGANWLWAWAAIELACLLPLLLPLTSNDGVTVRAAIREAQIGVVGRAILWLACGAGFALADRWDGAALAVRGLVLIASLLALPVACGWGPFGPETTLTPGGAERGQSAELRAVQTLLRGARSAVLAVAVVLATLPVAFPQPLIGAAVTLAGLAALTVGRNQLTGRFPRQTLRDSVQFALMWAGSVAVVANLGLALISIAGL